jgi:glutamate racemase
LIRDIMGEGVTIVDSASSCAGAVAKLLGDGGTVGTRGEKGRITYYVSDMPRRFGELGERFLGRRVDDVREHQFEGEIQR